MNCSCPTHALRLAGAFVGMNMSSLHRLFFNAGCACLRNAGRESKARPCSVVWVPMERNRNGGGAQAAEVPMRKPIWSKDETASANGQLGLIETRRWNVFGFAVMGSSLMMGASQCS